MFRRTARGALALGLTSVVALAPSLAARPVAAQTPPPDTCTFRRDKVAAPAVVRVGDSVGITLTLGGACPPAPGGAADIVLVIDHSGSMIGEKLTAAKSAASTFVDLIDFGVHRVGVVQFDDSAQIVLGLSDRPDAVKAAIAAIPGGGGTAIDLGIDMARVELSGPSRRPQAGGVIVLLSDGGSDSTDAIRAAQAAKSADLHIITIGFGNHAAEGLLRALATGPNDYVFAPTPADLERAYRQAADIAVTRLLFERVTVVDVVPDNMDYVAGSAAPPATLQGRTLTWRLDNVSSLGDLALRYRVAPRQPGHWPTNVVAVATFRDATGLEGQVVFPVPEIDVLPTLHLPLAARNACDVQARRHDVVVVVDTSSSMREPAGGVDPKLEAARGLARRFLRVIDYDVDRAAVVAFDAEARVVVGLSDDRDRILTGVAGLAAGFGTRIDRGLEAADALLHGGDWRGAAPVVVLLSDGRQNGDPAPVHTAAAALRARGVELYALGFGADVDASLLRAVATRPENVFTDPSDAELTAIYLRLALDLVCR